MSCGQDKTPKEYLIVKFEFDVLSKNPFTVFVVRTRSAGHTICTHFNIQLQRGKIQVMLS